MKTFRKWNGKAVAEGCTSMSKEATSFARAFRNMLKRELADSGVEIENFHIGHYDLSGFLKKGDCYIYFSYSIPRYGRRIDFNMAGCTEGVLYRTARGPKDYTGGRNNFCSIYEIPSRVTALFKRMEAQKAA